MWLFDETPEIFGPGDDFAIKALKADDGVVNSEDSDEQPNALEDE